ncbi:MAG: threonine ammonia-lyase, biosynthetic [Candidatus Hydrogenedens sp.]|nr:threonine ammonia-lyase, biosynthetic [Candidatus Hydrogenedens sp.]
MRQRLFDEILMARSRVYAVGQPTPLERIDLPIEAEVYLKREDLSPIYAYKWRGAYNRMAQLTEAERARGVVCASAGNHAQGVALAAARLGSHARIYMPTSTPRMKQAAVAKHGGDHAEVVLVGDSYSDAAAEALRDAAESGRTFVHAYDDFGTMGGQGTLADEIVMSGHGPFDAAYLQIGGGGMAAAVACWLKAYYPGIRIVGVEGVDQASMKTAIAAGEPVELKHVDVFCDGTAVRKAGQHTMPLCAELLDDIITVTNEEVAAAIELLWESRRVIAEPSGAMGVAGMMKERDRLKGCKVVAVLCGANVDFDQLAWIARHAAIGAHRRRYYRFEMHETPGGLLQLLDTLLEGVNIIEVQYGKVDESTAWPVIGFEASPPQLALLDRRLTEYNVPHEDVTSQEDVEFRIIHYNAGQFRMPYFIRLDFPERAGALRDFLLAMRDTASICYFNYTNTGEQIGRALIGFEFATAEARAQFLALLQASDYSYREIEEPILKRML